MPRRKPRRHSFLQRGITLSVHTAQGSHWGPGSRSAIAITFGIQNKGLLVLRKSSGCPQRCLQTSSPWVLSLCGRRPSDSFLESLRAAGNDLSAGPLGSCHTERLTETEADFQIRSRGLGLDKIFSLESQLECQALYLFVCSFGHAFIHSFTHSSGKAY